MELRLANEADLPRLKIMYNKIVTQMNENNIQIWDDVYPSEFLAEDIKPKHLYVLIDHETIVGAFALSDTHLGAQAMQWENTQAKAFYIDRFGVNADYLKRGLGSLMLKEAMTVAKDKAGEYLRLFVVDMNTPAIKLYIKNGFKQVEGVLEEKIDDELTLWEYGFEIKL